MANLFSCNIEYRSSDSKIWITNAVRDNSNIYSIKLIYCSTTDDSTDFYFYSGYPKMVATQLMGGSFIDSTQYAFTFVANYGYIAFLAFSTSSDINSRNTFMVPLVCGVKSRTYNLFDPIKATFNSSSIDTVYNFAVPENIIGGSGLSQLVTSGNIKAAVYNGKSYPPGATIPLDPSVDNISLVNQNYTLTMDDTQNMKNVQIDNTIYSDFPTTINVEKNTVLQMSGKDDPVITVDYTNTKVPTVKNT